MINNLDNLSYYAQTSLRRTMEKYSGTCRFIMWCKSLSKVIEPLKSRCICIRVGSPSTTELFKLSLHISAKENLNLTLEQHNNIITESKGSIRKLLWKLNLVKVGHYMINKFETPYDETIEQITDHIILCDLGQIGNIRNLIYNLIITNIEPTNIMRKIFVSLCMRNLPDKVKYKIINSASIYDHNLVRRRREIIHLEAFIINTMNHILNEKS